MKRPPSIPTRSRQAGRRPWFPLWVDEHMAETGSLSAAEHSAYVLLLLNYWRDGGLPNDRARLARMARMSPREWSKVEGAVSALFGPDWKHERLDELLAKASDISNKRRDAVNQREIKKPLHRGSNDQSNDGSFDASNGDHLMPYSIYPLQEGGITYQEESSRDDADDVFGAGRLA